MDKTRPVSSKLDLGAAPKIRSSKMEEISAEAAPAFTAEEVDNFLAMTAIEPPTWIDKHDNLEKGEKTCQTALVKPF